MSVYYSEKDKPSPTTPKQSPPVTIPLRKDTPSSPGTGKGVPRAPSINPTPKK